MYAYDVRSAFSLMETFSSFVSVKEFTIIQTHSFTANAVTALLK